MVRSGLFRVRQGEFKYLEARDLSVPNRARVELSLSSQDPVETGALVLSARFDNRILKNRPIRINGEEKSFSDTFRPDRKQIWFENRAPSRIEIPLRRGILRLCGNFSGTWTTIGLGRAKLRAPSEFQCAGKNLPESGSAS